MKTLTREDILAAKDFESEVVDVPEWGGKVRLRSAECLAGVKLENDQNALPNGREYEALFLLLAACICDDEGNLLFSPADVEELGSRNPKVLMRLRDVAWGLLGQKGRPEDAIRTTAAAEPTSDADPEGDPAESPSLPVPVPDAETSGKD